MTKKKPHPRLSFAHASIPNKPVRHGVLYFAAGEHLVLDRSFKAGRLRRSKGDPLCKPSGKFKELKAVRDAWVVCKRCRDIAERHGLSIPATENDKKAANGK